MGEEGAGISALKTSMARIRSGQSSHALVGASYNAEHPDMHLSHEIGHHMLLGNWSSVWQRDSTDGGGLIVGSGGAFLVLESRQHAKKRNARIYAVLDDIQADQGSATEEATHRRLNRLSDKAGLRNVDIIISGASGAKSRTSIEKNFLESELNTIPVRGFSSATGHLREAQFIVGVALAALSLHHGKNIDQIDSRFEAPATHAPQSVGVLTLGYDEAEGMARLTKETGA